MILEVKKKKKNFAEVAINSLLYFLLFHSLALRDHEFSISFWWKCIPQSDSLLRFKSHENFISCSSHFFDYFIYKTKKKSFLKIVYNDRWSKRKQWNKNTLKIAFSLWEQLQKGNQCIYNIYYTIKIVWQVVGICISGILHQFEMDFSKVISIAWKINGISPS